MCPVPTTEWHRQAHDKGFGLDGHSCSLIIQILPEPPNIITSATEGLRCLHSAIKLVCHSCIHEQLLEHNARA